MLAANLKFALFAALLASSGSTCHGQSSSGDVSKDDKPPPNVELAGVDTSALTPREKSEWSQYVSEFLSPCSDTPVPIAQCVNEKRACNKCVPSAKFVLKAVRDGMSREQVEKAYHNRFDADKIKNVPIDGSPSRGPESAPVTIIEFADFECPYCGIMAPILDKLGEDHKNDVRFVYKFLPLGGHPHGDIAARAGIAAWQAGKFWQMHHTLFSNQEHLEQGDLDSYAKDLGIDLGKFHADFSSQLATDRIAQDRKLADALGVKGTPTIYINGREFDPHDDLTEWVNLDLATGGGAPPVAATTDAGAASPSGSAAPDAGSTGKTAATASSSKPH
ncbi:MAG: thioredoxin domain-containing protein [Polyangiaceae bacterium]